MTRGKFFFSSLIPCHKIIGNILVSLVALIILCSIAINKSFFLFLFYRYNICKDKNQPCETLGTH